MSEDPGEEEVICCVEVLEPPKMGSTGVVASGGGLEMEVARAVQHDAR